LKRKYYRRATKPTSKIIVHLSGEKPTYGESTEFEDQNAVIAGYIDFGRILETFGVTVSY
jgi:hypothetical protein